MSHLPTFGSATEATEAANALAPYIKGKTVLITGVSKGGLGFEAARAIAYHEPKLLILSGRSDDKNKEAEGLIKAEVPSANIRLLKLDLGSFATVRESAKFVESWDKSEVIDVLINNAATMGGPYKLTPDGIENNFAVNHLSVFLFTNLILPRVLAAGSGARIINVSSRGHHRSPIRWTDYNFKEDGSYGDGLVPYGQSKTGNMLFSVSLAAKLAPKGILAFSLHPGGIWTNLARSQDMKTFIELGFLDEDLKPVNSEKLKWKTLEQGASTTVIAAFDPRIVGESGGYLFDGQVRVEEAAPYALDPGSAERLWGLSEELVGEKFEL